MRSELVWSVWTGWMRAAPSSAAFSTMKSVRAFLIGAKTSHRSGGSSCGAEGATSSTAPPRLAACTSRAVHSPCRPLKTAISAPGDSRITVER